MKIRDWFDYLDHASESNSKHQDLNIFDLIVMIELFHLLLDRDRQNIELLQLFIGMIKISTK